MTSAGEAIFTQVDAERAKRRGKVMLDWFVAAN